MTTEGAAPGARGKWWTGSLALPQRGDGGS